MARSAGTSAAAFGAAFRAVHAAKVAAGHSPAAAFAGLRQQLVFETLAEPRAGASAALKAIGAHYLAAEEAACSIPHRVAITLPKSPCETDDS